MKITILGAGAFGFAIGTYLAKNNSSDSVVLYDIDSSLVQHINENHLHKYFFEGIISPSSLSATTDLQSAINNVDVLIISVPTQLVRSVLDSVFKLLSNQVIILNTSKGIETSTGLLVHSIVFQLAKKHGKKYSYGSLCGGMIAQQFIELKGIFGAEIAARAKRTRKILKRLFVSNKLYINISDDVVGIEAAGALKNVVAIAAGIIDGLGYPYASKTFIVSLGGKDLEKLGLKMGGKKQSFGFETQSFGNDYVMSTTGQTRNRYFGELLGNGLSIEEALLVMKKEHKTAEGYYTTKAAFEFANKNNLSVPVIDFVYSVLYKEHSVTFALSKLMKSIQK